jgi:hypothetical protein
MEERIMTENIVSEDNMSLDELVVKIKDCHDEIEGWKSETRSSLRLQTKSSYLAGVYLNEAKKLVPHGKWEKWVEGNSPFKMRVAQNYMLLAEEMPNLMDELKNESNSFLTYTRCLAKAKKQREERQKKDIGANRNQPRQARDPFEPWEDFEDCLKNDPDDDPDDELNDDPDDEVDDELDDEADDESDDELDDEPDDEPDDDSIWLEMVWERTEAQLGGIYKEFGPAPTAAQELFLEWSEKWLEMSTGARDSFADCFKEWTRSDENTQLLFSEYVAAQNPEEHEPEDEELEDEELEDVEPD